MSASDEALSKAEQSRQFDAVLAKPFDITDLVECVERHVAA